MTPPIAVGTEVREALDAGRPVVALETTLVAARVSGGTGADVGHLAEQRIRAAGAVPATIGVVDGAVRVGLAPAEIDRFAGSPDARKVGPRDLAACCVQGALGATTVGGTLAACGLAGIHVFATGGLGGVHRGYAAAAGRLRGPRRARAGAGLRRLLGRQVAARRAGDRRGARDARRARARLARERAAALLCPGRRPTARGQGRVGRRGRRRRASALGTRASRRGRRGKTSPRRSRRSLGGGADRRGAACCARPRASAVRPSRRSSWPVSTRRAEDGRCR